MVFSDEHLDDLHKRGYKITVLEYVYLSKVSRLQQSKTYGFWCVMPNAKFAEQLKISDKGLRKLQDRMVDIGLLEKGNGTKKRALPAFTDWRETEQSTESELSTYRNSVPINSELSTDQSRNSVPINSELSTYKPIKPINKPKTTRSGLSLFNKFMEGYEYKRDIVKAQEAWSFLNQIEKEKAIEKAPLWAKYFKAEGMWDTRYHTTAYGFINNKKFNDDPPKAVQKPNSTQAPPNSYSLPKKYVV